MIKKLLFVIGILVLIGLADIVFLILKNQHSHQQQTTMPHMMQKSSVNKEKHPIMLFYSQTCPHCIVVEEFITKNAVDKKIMLEQKEVSHNKQNLELLIQTARDCDLGTDTVGVPFLQDGSKCLTGDKNIIDYFNQKLHEK